MQSKQVGVILGLVAAVIVIIGGVILLSHKTSPTPTPTPSPTPKQSDQVTPGEAKIASITIQNFAFAPASLTVKKGTTVTWTNQDSVSHTITSDDNSPSGGPNGPLIAKTQKYSFTFDTVGTFTYHCTPHPSMHGSVVVTP